MRKLNFKKIIAGIVASFMFAPVMPSIQKPNYIIQANAETSASDFEFDAETGTITKYIGEGGDAVIPSEIDGVTITSIGEKAFFDCSNLTSVTIPDSVTSISNYAFYVCSNLTSVIIPDSVTSIGDYAFIGSENLTSVTIPDGVTNIGKGLFAGCTRLTSITIPDGVTSIGEGAFSGCSNLTSIIIPDKVTSIEYRTFWECTRLTSITIPNSVTSIDSKAFENCYKIQDVYYSGTKEEWRKLNNFSDNKYLSNATIHFNPSEQSTTTNPSDVIIKASADDFKFDAETGKIIKYYGQLEENNIEIPSEINGVAVTCIGTRAFEYCSFKSVIIPDSVTNIEYCAFYTCQNLVSVKISGRVTSIGYFGFVNCFELASITIPNSVTNIDWCAFDGCTRLKDVYYSGTKEEWDSINIDTGNNYLLNATIHFKSNEPFTLGDINNDNKIDASDASQILKIYALLSTSGEPEETEEQMEAADVNKDGKVDASDASYVLGYYAYLSTITGTPISIEEFIS